MMTMSDAGKRDEKIICVHLDDPEYRSYEHLDELPGHRLAELRRFFEAYKRLEEKEVCVEDFFGPEAAKDAVAAAMARYSTGCGSPKRSQHWEGVRE